MDFKNFLKSSIVAVLHLGIVLILSSCSSTPSVLEPNEKTMGIDDLEHFSRLKKKSPQEVVDTVSNEQLTPTEKAYNASVDAAESLSKKDDDESLNKNVDGTQTSKKSSGVPKKEAAFYQSEAGQQTIKREKEQTNQASSVKLPNLDTRKTRKTKRTRLDVPELDVKLDESSRLFQTLSSFKNKTVKASAKLTDSQSRAFCSTSSARLDNYDLLTQIISYCQWKLPLVLKMNNIKTSADFDPQEKFYFPPVLYQSDVFLPDDNNSTFEVNCEQNFSTVSSLSDINLVADGCAWDKNALITINHVQPNSLLAQNRLIALPPLIKELRDQQIQIQKNNELNSPKSKKTRKSQPKNRKAEWCDNPYYLTTSEAQTIEKISLKCFFNIRLMSRLNDIMASEKLPNDTELILPKAFDIVVKTRKYNIPFDRKNCSKKLYKVEYGISIGKISSTCQWNYKHLLALNNLEKSSILSIGQQLVFPRALHVAPKKQSSINSEANTKTYDAKLCRQSSYLFTPNDSLRRIAELCKWSLSHLLALNKRIIKNIHKQPQVLLFPPAIYRSIRLETKRLRQNSFAKQAKPVALCSKKTTVLSTKQTLQTLAAACKWNSEFLRKLNSGKSVDTIILPPTLYNHFGEIQKWQLPIKNSYQPITQENSNNVLSIKTAKKITLVRNLQNGLVIFIEKYSENGKYSIIVKHSENYISIYKNLDTFTVKAGVLLDRDQVVGKIMSDSSQPGLQYQLLKDGKNVSLIQLLSPSTQ